MKWKKRGWGQCAKTFANWALSAEGESLYLVMRGRKRGSLGFKGGKLSLMLCDGERPTDVQGIFPQYKSVHMSIHNIYYCVNWL